MVTSPELNIVQIDLRIVKEPKTTSSDKLRSQYLGKPRTDLDLSLEGTDRK